MNLILASSSPARKMLMDRLGLDYKVIVPDIDETPQANESAQQLVQRLAYEKARKISQQYANAIIIGADQVVILNEHIVSKPVTHEAAVAQLLACSGKTITSYTGLCVLNSSTQQAQQVVAPYQVQFRPLTLQQIERYLLKDKPYHCAGSIRVEGPAIALFERFIGDDFNTLIGLPLIQLSRMLEKEGINII